MSIDEVQSQIQAANETANRLSTTYSAVGGGAEQVAQQFAGMSAEGAATKMVEVARLLGEIPALLAAVTAKAAEANAVAESAKGLRDDTVPARGTPATRTATKSGIPGFQIGERHPDAAVAVRRFGWPKGPSGRTKARGLMFNADGETVLHRPLKALRKGTTYPAPDLKEPWRSDPDMKTSWHIEGGVAAYMRNTKTKEMALYITLPPCGGPVRPDPKGCDENLSKILPRGYKLHVHTEREGGRFDYDRYVGTGEAVRDDG